MDWSDCRSQCCPEVTAPTKEDLRNAAIDNPNPTDENNVFEGGAKA
ncbi:MAG: hypothetical protein UV46_C0023G0018, partial [Candidatus Gottesmanbacteria bacterium GW2011_GWC2_42_8]